MAVFSLLAALLLFECASACSSRNPREYGGMVRIEGGEFLMGADDGFAFEGPAHRVRVDSFWIDQTEEIGRAHV